MLFHCATKQIYIFSTFGATSVNDGKSLSKATTVLAKSPGHFLSLPSQGTMCNLHGASLDWPLLCTLDSILRTNLHIRVIDFQDIFVYRMEFDEETRWSY